jgi:hypothetical protein
MRRAIQRPNLQARLVIDFFRHRNWENGSVNWNVQIRAIKRDTLLMPGHRVRRGRALSGPKHSGAAILISAYTQLAHKMGQGFAALDAVLSHYRTGNSTDGFHNGYVARVNAHAPGARPPSGRNSDRTSELGQ